jgi:2-keto-4-pentenoate hydratase/2-oxohepta-3-ene-1,7-dioic acid hydratase in catechol pathway
MEGINMKLAMIDDYLPALVEGEAVSLVAECLPEVMAQPGFLRSRAIIEGWETYKPRLEAARVAPRTLGAVRLRAPIPRPVKLLCAQMSFREGLSEVTIKPSFFVKSSTSVIGPNDIVELPPVDAWVFHHEAELAVIIGKGAKAVAPERAMDHVFGYTCFMDISARGIGAGTSYEDKSYDTFGPMGPWILTADEIPDPHSLQVKLWVNGNLRHDYPMSDIGNPIAQMISSASAVAALEPGDVIALGVNHQGLGPVQGGDRVRIEIAPIGGFEVAVQDKLARRWESRIDTGCAAAVRRIVRGEPMGTLDMVKRLDRTA